MNNPPGRISMFLTFAIIYILFTLVVLLCSNYYLLFSSRDRYTREELADFSPFLQKLGEAIRATGSIPVFIAGTILSSILGMAVPYLFRGWISHSVIITLIVCLSLPLIKNILAGQHGTKGGKYQFIKNYVIRYHYVLALGFGTGSGVMIVYNFRDMKEINSFFLVINILAIVVINCFVLIRMLHNSD